MKRISVLIVLMLLAGINSSSFAGDPLDSNDVYVEMNTVIGDPGDGLELNAVTGDPLDEQDTFISVNAVTGDPVDGWDIYFVMYQSFGEQYIFMITKDWKCYR